MYVYLSKILPLFVMPISIALFLVLLALLFLRRESPRLAGSSLALAFLVLWISSMPIVASSLYGVLEARYPARPVASFQDGDCIVVLGGVVSAPMPPRVDIEFNEAVDRVYKAAQLFREGNARVVIVTAGNQPWSESRWVEAELIRDLLVEWGVPHEAVVLEGSSRNTRENAVYSKNIIDAYMCKSTLLVTSAAHMPRSVAAFRSIGVVVTPVTTDVRITDSNRITAMDFLPDARALAMTSEAIREWIGRWYYDFQGWN